MYMGLESGKRSFPKVTSLAHMELYSWSALCTVTYLTLLHMQEEPVKVHVPSLSARLIT